MPWPMLDPSVFIDFLILDFLYWLFLPVDEKFASYLTPIPPYTLPYQYICTTLLFKLVHHMWWLRLCPLSTGEPLVSCPAGSYCWLFLVSMIGSHIAKRTRLTQHSCQIVTLGISFIAHNSFSVFVTWNQHILPSSVKRQGKSCHTQQQKNWTSKYYFLSK